MKSIGKVVLTGGPGSGKTSLIKGTLLNKHNLVPEVARDLINFMKEYEPSKLKRDAYFQEVVETLQLKQYASNLAGIFDRGLPDQIAYRKCRGLSVPPALYENCEKYRYDKVFLFPFWPEIYTQDNVRQESPAQAELIGWMIHAAYKKVGYSPIIVPFGTVEERVAFIQKELYEEDGK